MTASDEEQFALLNGPDAEVEEVSKPFLRDKRQVKAHLKHHFPDNTWNSKTVSTAISHWRSGGAIFRCRHPLVDGGNWQRIDITKLSGSPPPGQVN